jgi:hypothetical protein
MLRGKMVSRIPGHDMPFRDVGRSYPSETLMHLKYKARPQLEVAHSNPKTTLKYHQTRKAHKLMKMPAKTSIGALAKQFLKRTKMGKIATAAGKLLN